MPGCKKKTSILPKKLIKELGLWEYRRRDPTLDATLGWYYVAVKEQDAILDAKPTSIYCGIGEKIKGDRGSVQCEVNHYIRDNLRLTYYFFHKHISDWREIDASVRTLVESFITGG